MLFGRQGLRTSTWLVNRGQVQAVLGTFVVALGLAAATSLPAAARSVSPKVSTPKTGTIAAQSSDRNVNAVAEARAMVVLTNRLRASLGAGNLAVRDDLTSLACEWAQTMANVRALEHSPYIYDRALFSRRIGRDWELAGENVGTGSDIYTIHGALMGSPSHYANLANPEFEYVGICVRHSADGNAYVAQEFLSAKPNYTRG